MVQTPLDTLDETDVIPVEMFYPGTCVKVHFNCLDLPISVSHKSLWDPTKVYIAEGAQLK